jgi:hypothetical protein
VKPIVQPIRDVVDVATSGLHAAYCAVSSLSINFEDVVKAWSIGETAAFTVAAGAIAVGGTAACLGATAGNPACGLIFITAGTVAAGGVYGTIHEINEF